MKKFKINCRSCDYEVLDQFVTVCPNCNGFIDISYDLSLVKLRKSLNPYERFFDMLPVKDIGFLPQVEMSPLIKAKNLGKRLGLNHLYLKNETTHPTGTTKDRMAYVSLPYMFESGVRHFCTSSTGNSSTSYAQSIHRLPEMKMSVFTAENFVHRVHYDSSSQINHYGLRGASFVEAGDYAMKYSKLNGLTGEAGFFNLGRREGLKTIWYEISEQADQEFDWYVQAVSSAMGVYGVYKAATELYELGLAKKIPKILCVQQQTCMPMVQAWKEESDSIQPHHIVYQPKGVAEAILRGNPTKAYPIVRDVVMKSKGDMCAVDEQQIHQAQNWIFEDEGLSVCPASAATIAALMKLQLDGRQFHDQRIVVNISGSIRANQSIAKIDKWLERNEYAK
jgi:threonine synthase